MDTNGFVDQIDQIEQMDLCIYGSNSSNWTNGCSGCQWIPVDRNVKITIIPTNCVPKSTNCN